MSWLADQFYMLASTRFFLYHDIRSPKYPVFQTLHYSDQYPPTVFERFAYDTDYMTVEQQIKCLEETGSAQVSGSASAPNFVVAFSPAKHGGAFFVPVSTGELLKHHPISQEPQVNVGRMSDMQRYAFHPRRAMLYPIGLVSSNIMSNELKTRGICGFALPGNSLVFQLDQRMGLTLQCFNGGNQVQPIHSPETIKQADIEQHPHISPNIDRIMQLQYDKLFQNRLDTADEPAKQRSQEPQQPA